MQNHQSVTSTGFEFPEHEQLKCPRCYSSNTKFCYYNNYNLSQPRHFCKNCRRYWTKGGTLRNIPVGGGCRKNSKRPATVAVSKQQQQQRRVVQNSSASTVPYSGSNSEFNQNSSLKFEPSSILRGTGVRVGSSTVPADSYTSLLGLASYGQFGNFTHGSGQNMGPQVMSEGFPINGLQNGNETNCWAIKNPGSKLQ